MEPTAPVTTYERIAQIVYVDAGPLPRGMAVIDFNKPQAQEEWRKQVAEEGDGWRLPAPPFAPEADPDNLAGLSDDHLARMRLPTGHLPMFSRPTELAALLLDEIAD
ncbi:MULTISPECIES: hypothetical protein [Streptomyces]|uniref:hypothetical protein n=1 Tax=Streptomyces TaxID=1883 RepID=UPI003440378E